MLNAHVSVPLRLRARLGLQEGDLLRIDEEDGALLVRQEKVVAGLVERDGLLFKPRDRKAGPIDIETINQLIDTMRDPVARAELERREESRAKRAKKKRK